MVAALLGAALVMGSLSSFAPVPLFVILMEALFIPLEERNMEKSFGQRYAEYRKRVRRWV
jgi:protein-S-isoprenylcysteine O-methyltransferase Ste14